MRASSTRAEIDHLQRDEAVELRVPGLVDDAHAAAADLLLDPVALAAHRTTGAGGRACDRAGSSWRAEQGAEFGAAFAVAGGYGLEPLEEQAAELPPRPGEVVGHLGDGMPCAAASSA